MYINPKKLFLISSAGCLARRRVRTSKVLSITVDVTILLLSPQSNMAPANRTRNVNISNGNLRSIFNRRETSFMRRKANTASRYGPKDVNPKIPINVVAYNPPNSALFPMLCFVFNENQEHRSILVGICCC